MQAEILEQGVRLEQSERDLAQRQDQADEESVRLKRRIEQIDARILQINRRRNKVLREIIQLRRALQPRRRRMIIRPQHHEGSENYDPNEQNGEDDLETQSAFVFLV